MTRPGDPSVLSARLDEAVRSKDHAAAERLYRELAAVEPSEPRWPHRMGDLLLRLGRGDEAVEAYERAVELYARSGFVARAAAMAKVILGIRPARRDVLERVDPEAARRLVDRERKTLDEIPPAPIESGIPPARASRPWMPTARPSLMEEALRLERADDAAADEVRFSDAVEIPIEIAVEEVLGSGAGESPSPDGTRPPEVLARFASVPLFTDVPRPALERLIEGSDLVDREDGELLLRAGEPADALFVLVEGKARIVVPGLESLSIVLGEGEVLGESCLLENVERGADVVAQGSVRALRLPRTLLEALVAEIPAVGDVVLELLTRRLLGNLVRTSPIFAAFDPPTRLELARMFEVRRAEAGTRLIEAGKRSDGLYVLLAGHLELGMATGTIALGPGTTVGERSLLSRAPASASVRAVSDCLLLRLPTARFAELAALYPPVLAHLAELEERRR